MPAHRIRNAPAVSLDGCYAFIALILLLGLFYQGTLTEYLSRNPLTNSGIKLIKIDGLTDILRKEGKFVCNVYGISYCVAGTTNATPMESNDGFLLWRFPLVDLRKQLASH